MIKTAKSAPIKEFWERWTPELAYVLGFLYADGCVVSYDDKHRYGLRMNLNNRDRHILETIKQVAGGYLYPSRTNDQTVWMICGKWIVAQVSRLGLIPRKTFRQKMPRVPSRLTRHFIRGYFDGDGCISLCRMGGYLRPVFTIAAANRTFLDQLRNALPVECKPPRRATGKVWDIRITKRKSIRRICAWLYRDAGALALQRKQQKASEMLSEIVAEEKIRQRRTPWGERQVATLRRLYGTVAVRVIARKMGLKKIAIYHKAQSLGLASNVRHDQHGAGHWNVRLTESDVRAIFASRESAKVLADRHGISTSLVYRIRRGNIWTHLKLAA
jgi:hypothetical protein